MESNQEHDRVRAIERCLKGESITAIARSMGYSPRWIYKWFKRYRAQSHHETPWAEDQSKRPHSNSRQVTEETGEAVKLVRLNLYNQGLFCGAQAIAWELEELAVRPVPSIRTINRILNREDWTRRRTGRYESKGRKYPKLIGQLPMKFTRWITEAPAT